MTLFGSVLIYLVFPSRNGATAQRQRSSHRLRRGAVAEKSSLVLQQLFCVAAGAVGDFERR
jgi:hypothetical protein